MDRPLNSGEQAESDGTSLRLRPGETAEDALNRVIANVKRLAVEGGDLSSLSDAELADYAIEAEEMLGGDETDVAEERILFSDNEIMRRLDLGEAPQGLSPEQASQIDKFMRMHTTKEGFRRVGF